MAGTWTAPSAAALAVLAATGAGSGCAFWGMSEWSANEGATLTGDAGATDARGDGSNPGEDAAPDAAPIPVLARDGFSREVPNGFGGGPWSTSLAGGALLVTGGAGIFRLSAPSAGPSATIPNVASDDVDVQLALTSEKIGDGGGLYFAVLVRRIDASRNYNGRIAVRPDGVVDAALARTESNEPTYLGRASALFAVKAGEPMRMRLQATGVRPTQVRLKSWRAADAEPTKWAIEATDSEPEWQTQGTVGISPFLSSTATNAPFDVRIDDLLVRPASRL